MRRTRSPGPAWGWLGMGGWAEEGCLDLTWINVGFKKVHSWRSRVLGRVSVSVSWVCVYPHNLLGFLPAALGIQVKGFSD